MEPMNFYTLMKTYMKRHLSLEDGLAQDLEEAGELIGTASDINNYKDKINQYRLRLQESYNLAASTFQEIASIDPSKEEDVLSITASFERQMTLLLPILQQSRQEMLTLKMSLISLPVPTTINDSDNED